MESEVHTAGRVNPVPVPPSKGNEARDAGTQRLAGVEVLRVVAIAAIIVIHLIAASGVPVGQGWDLATSLDQAARFAVPFFFVIAGFFWDRKARQAANPWQVSLDQARRLLRLFLLGSLIYLLPTNFFGSLAEGPLGPLKWTYWNLASAVRDPFRVLQQGTRVHLWFLMALTCCTLLTGWTLRRLGMGALLVLSAVCYGIALSGKPYAATGWGLAMPAGVELRNGPFFGWIYFVAGALLSRHGRPSPAWFWPGVGWAVFGAAIHGLEVNFLHERYGVPCAQEFVLGTLPLGVGVAMVALSGRIASPLKGMAILGPHVLGIYLVHQAFVDLLLPLKPGLVGSLAAWLLLGVPVVGLASWGLTRTLNRWPAWRALVDKPIPPPRSA